VTDEFRVCPVDSSGAPTRLVCDLMTVDVSNPTPDQAARIERFVFTLGK
jgi:hypothetical protein